MTRTRRSLALTPLIDVIFLLLLFFMLTTSFQRERDLPLVPPGAGTAQAEPTRAAFLDLGPDSLTLNGAPLDLAELSERLSDEAALLIRLQPGVTAQRMIDVLAPLSRRPDLSVEVLG